MINNPFVLATIVIVVSLQHCTLHVTHAFIPPYFTRESYFRLSSGTESIYFRHSSVQAATALQQAQGSNNNESEESSSSSSSSVTDMIFSNSKSILSSAFSALKEEDQYDAVLTGLCAKILDDKMDEDPNEDGEDKTTATVDKIEDKSTNLLNGPISLLKEMNNRQVRASPRSLAALVDVATKTESAIAMSNVLSLSVRNGGIRAYGMSQNMVNPLPRKTTSVVAEALPPVPTDDRTTEIASAVSLALLVTVSFVLSGRVGSGPALVGDFYFEDDLTGVGATFILYSLGLAAIVDNGYDALAALGKVADVLLKFSGAKMSLPKLPLKEDMPFGIGKGEISGVIGAGFSRLLSSDLERECQCEAAAFYAAYCLGLPCFAFRPNSLEAANLIFDSMGTTSSLDPLLSSAGVLNVLIWLLAPVAMEDMKYPQLISSDPREASELLSRMEKSCQDQGMSDLFNEVLPESIGDEDQDTSRTLVLAWAYREARNLLNSNKKVVGELVERLVGGAATVGDCVAVLEGW